LGNWNLLHFHELFISNMLDMYIRVGDVIWLPEQERTMSNPFQDIRNEREARKQEAAQRAAEEERRQQEIRSKISARKDAAIAKLDADVRKVLAHFGEALLDRKGLQVPTISINSNYEASQIGYTYIETPAGWGGPYEKSEDLFQVDLHFDEDGNPTYFRFRGQQADPTIESLTGALRMYA
jgi:seryl-tRNA synthetase